MAVKAVRDKKRLLSTPERNHFFYGKLMDVDQFEKETRYFNEKRWLLNRLVLGRGVVCGLKVQFLPGKPGWIVIEPGVALDGWGREIIVPALLHLDARQLTDDQGNPAGEVSKDPVLVGLAYAEEKTEPVPVLVPECDTPSHCAPNTIRECFRPVVRQAKGRSLPGPPECTFRDLPLENPPDLHKILCQRLFDSTAGLPEDSWVPLALVTLPRGKIQPWLHRPLAYNNSLLFELILCLAARLQELEKPVPPSP